MQEDDDDFGVTSEDTEILNLPLYTERKADGIYRYRRRVPKALRGRVGKGYLYRNLGRTNFKLNRGTALTEWRSLIAS